MAFHDIEKLIELREGIMTSKARVIIFQEFGLGMKVDRLQTAAEWANDFEIKDSHSASAKQTLEATRVVVVTAK